MTATYDWKVREEANQNAKGVRRHRPGVTFEFTEDVIDIDEMASAKPVPMRRSSRRYETK